jgi:hypothetical protein
MRHRFLNLYQRYRIAKFRFLSDCANVQGKPIIRQPVQFVGKGTIRFNGKVNLGFYPSPLELLHFHESRDPDRYPNRRLRLDEQQRRAGRDGPHFHWQADDAYIAL